MQENEEQNRGFRLVDEALAFEPIKNSFRLAWEFITLNQKFTLTALVLFILLNILGMIPMIALIFMVLSAVFSLAIQIHIGRTLYLAESIKTYIEEIEESSVEAILNRHTATAFGAYLGWITLFVMLIVLVTSVGGSMGLINENMSESDLINALLLLGFPLLLVALVFSYIQPLVQSNIVLSNGFQEGFKAVFTIFSINLWRLSFQKSYFKYVASFGTVIILVLFILAFLVGMITSITGLAMLGNILLMVLMYVFMIFMVVGSMMARRIAEV